jgi:Tol biopolymer transport system component
MKQIRLPLACGIFAKFSTSFNKSTNLLLVVGITLAASACVHSPSKKFEGNPALLFPGEKHFGNIRQITFGGTNAEAYWSFDGQWLSFQHKGRDNAPNEPQCDQIYAIRPDGTERHMVSNGKGRTTCAFYFHDNSRILFASTFATDQKCPAAPDMSRGYVWPIYNSYQIYSARPDGSDVIPLEPGAPRAYNAEMTVCHDGSVIFTSDRDGDLDLYRGKLDPIGTISDVHRVTSILGYDGGAAFSPDCKKIVWRASRPKAGKEANDYKALLQEHLVRPTQLEIWTANVDGSHARQITRMHAASFAPYFTPDGKKIIFSSNPSNPRGRKFDLFMINEDGTGLEQVTYSGTFDSFPMFSPDGKYIAFSSNRNAKDPHETNVFVAEWIADPANNSDKKAANDSDPANRYMSLVQKLSVPEMQGRGVGTEGLQKAEKLVSDTFSELGLKPLRLEKETPAFVQKVEFVATKTRPATEARNVVGTWGNACGKVRPVLIGAHLDHLGNGAENSLEPTKSGIHPGADDNASGVAGMIEAARIITADKSIQEKSCFIFAAFTGEEIGIVGSSQLVRELKRINQLPKAMLNLDMVGRMEANKLTIFGTDSAKEWKAMTQEECERHQLECPGGGDGYGPSDHMSFYIAHVPVLHFFTGPHVDYHRTSDIASKINATGGIQTAEVVAALALKVASPRQKLHYEKSSTASPNLFGKVRTSHGAYLGTIPDYSTLSSPHGVGGGGMPEGGIRLAGTRPGSPADQAGVQEGDVLSGIDGAKIGTLEDFMKILSGLHPGQKITLAIRRNGKALQLPATVGKKE